MNDSRPPMNSAEFSKGMKPIWIQKAVGGRRSSAGFTKGDLCRWLVTREDRKLWPDDVITKGADIWDYLIQPYCERIEVMDLAVQTIYYIGAQAFHENKQTDNKDGRYYLVKRDLWERELLTMYPGVD